MHMTTIRHTLRALLLASLAMITTAGASDWTGGGDGTSFSDAGNWSAGVPGFGDDALYGGTFTTTIVFPAGTTTNQRFTVEASGAPGNSFIWDIGAGNTYQLIGSGVPENRVALSQDSALTVVSGTVLNEVVGPGSDPALTIGRNTATGTLTLTGAGTIWDQPNDYTRVGDNAGRGILQVLNGALFDSGTVHMNVAAGHSLAEPTLVIVDGGGSEILTKGANIGLLGTAVRMELTNGGKFTSAGSSMSIASNSGSGPLATTIIIDGAGSLLTSSFNTIEIGINSVSSTANTYIEVTNGGAFGSDALGLGQARYRVFPGSSVNLLVDGAGSVSKATSLFMSGESATSASGGATNFTISNGGRVQSNLCVIHPGGKVTLDGGQFAWNTSTDASDNVMVQKGIIEGAGLVRDVQQNGVIDNTGTIAPEGTLLITGNDLTVNNLAGGKMAFDLRGTGDYDVLEISAASEPCCTPKAVLDAASTVEITVAGTFEDCIAVGDTFDILTARNGLITNNVAAPTFTQAGYAGTLSVVNISASRDALRLELTAVPQTCDDLEAAFLEDLCEAINLTDPTTLAELAAAAQALAAAATDCPACQAQLTALAQ